MKEILIQLGITKETLTRAGRTFLQAAVAYIAVNLAAVDFTSGKEVAKTALIGLAVSALSAGIAAVMNLNKPQQKGGAGMTFSAWINKYLGKKTDYDGAYGVQCVDLIDCYIDKCLALQKGFWGNAKYWWLNRNKSTWLKNNFDFITPAYKNGELKTGDIGIRTSGTYGHIFIIKEPAKNGKVKYYDQNATGSGDAMTLREKPYTSAYINGVLRPKNQTNLTERKSKTMPYGNAAMTSAQPVYADSALTLKVGSVSKNERVLWLGTGAGNPMLSYKTDTGYKVGFVKKAAVKKD